MSSSDLKNFPLFSDLPQSILDNLFREHRLMKLKRGDFLYHAGEKATRLFLVKKGLVGVVMHTSKGGAHLLRLYRSGQFLGHRALFAEEDHFGSCQALEGSEIVIIPSFCVFRLMDSYPRLAMLFLKHMSGELRLAEQQRVNISESDVEARVAAALLYIKQVDADRNWTRKEIADFCGSTGPTVIKVILRFSRSGWIKLNGRRIEILRKENLVNIANRNGAHRE